MKSPTGDTMRKLILAAALAVLASTAMAQPAGTTFDMFVGEIRVLRLGEIERVAVGNSAIVSTSALKNGQLVVLAEKVGVTSLHVWFPNGRERDYTVTVGAKYTRKGTGEVRQLLEGIPGITVREVGERIVLSGQIPAEYAVVVQTVKSEFPDVLDLTRTSDPLLPENKMVLMNVKFTEFNLSELESLGISWDQQIAGPSAGVYAPVVTNDLFVVTNPEPPLSFAGALAPGLESARGFFGIASEITSRINLLVSNGDALVLAEPRLSARSGGEAEFLSGGEFPIPTTGSLGQTNVEFKEFGIKLNISPVVDEKDNILARVETEVSSIDQSVAVDGIPGLLTRRTSADISMRVGQTLVISGLLSRETAEDVSKLPFLGDIPILGWLFKSKNFRDRKTELVIFVTPTVIQEEGGINQEALRRRQEMIEEFQKAIDRGDLKIID